MGAGNHDARSWLQPKGFDVSKSREQRQLEAEFAQIEKMIEALSVRWQFVQIFVSRDDPTKERTTRYCAGNGSLYARLGQVKEWTIMQDEMSRLEARQDFHAQSREDVRLADEDDEVEE